jgi:hypothetical protein
MAVGGELVLGFGLKNCWFSKTIVGFIFCGLASCWRFKAFGGSEEPEFILTFAVDLETSTYFQKRLVLLCRVCAMF